ncbi:hypothetical protein G9U51_10100 [Calidifontibacter sp. DB0510]|uniref:Uncharacterized protein n=1 Tax=Metallococcus carri TaxID=1656884 RepID=A0A967B245_9MICO|nr:hypothetical protein [Metallococcus carri]NHN56128.1 hypothetical protein [Metallococcus carri]NOP37415.1 hypothetical protein [Calidifontibacter sp. DB2511S]
MTQVLIVVGLGLVAVVLGGPLTVGVFKIVDRSPAQQHTPHTSPMTDDTLESAASLLRGGTWIGVLERIAIYASLVAGWREMVAVALAIKALGRYPELRSGDNPAVAERFIIGTFVSVLWACAAAALAIWLR